MSLRPLAASVLLAAAVVLSGCATTVHLEPAADANNPACAGVTVALQNVSSLADLPRLWTDAQATGAWGADGKSSVILSCGVTVPGPTAELQCVTVEGVDWLVDTTDTPNIRLTTYGRDPAVQVYIDTSVVSSNDVVASRGLVGAVSSIPATRACTTPDELDDEVQDQLDGTAG